MSAKRVKMDFGSIIGGNADIEALIPILSSDEKLTYNLFGGGAKTTPDPADTTKLYYAFNGDDDTRIGYHNDGVSGGYVEYTFDKPVDIIFCHMRASVYQASNNIQTKVKYTDTDGIEHDWTADVYVSGTVWNGDYRDYYFANKDPIVKAKKIKLWAGQKKAYENIYISQFQAYGYLSK